MGMKAIESMSADELWTLYEEVSSVLAEKISTEKAKLEERLRKLETASHAINLDGVRRPYPKVLPKYQNPKNPAETWSGRGKQPHWVQAQLEAGERLEYLLIARPRRSPAAGKLTGAAPRGGEGTSAREVDL
jgi:DNA-binding protein H-NS